MGGVRVKVRSPEGPGWDVLEIRDGIPATRSAAGTHWRVPDADSVDVIDRNVTDPDVLRTAAPAASVSWGRESGRG